MPNPTVNMNRKLYKKLSDKQKTIVQNLKRKHNIGMSKLKVYRRAGANSGYSVHNPILDARRKSKNSKNPSKYPHARDTPFQRKNSSSRTVKKKIGKKKVGRSVGVRKPRSFMSKLLNP